MVRRPSPSMRRTDHPSAVRGGLILRCIFDLRLVNLGLVPNKKTLQYKSYVDSEADKSSDTDSDMSSDTGSDMTSDMGSDTDSDKLFSSTSDSDTVSDNEKVKTSDSDTDKVKTSDSDTPLVSDTDSDTRVRPTLVGDSNQGLTSCSVSQKSSIFRMVNPSIV